MNGLEPLVTVHTGTGAFRYITPDLLAETYFAPHPQAVDLNSGLANEVFLWSARMGVAPHETTAAVSAASRSLVPLDLTPQAVSLVATASERGTALHKAIRVLLLRPDLRPHPSAATGFNEATLDLLQAQADALKQWLTAGGYTQIECEVRIQKREVSGKEFNGIIDLLATSDGKRLILDHKSGPGSFADYYVQLQAYQKFLQHAEDTDLVEIALHWIDRATVEIKDAMFRADGAHETDGGSCVIGNP